MEKLTLLSTRELSAYIAGQQHAMAGATIAASASLAASLGTACVRISMLHMDSADEIAAATAVAKRLAAISEQLSELADADGAAITTYAALRETGQTLQGQERLCQMPVETSQLAAAAAMHLQEFRPSALAAEDDLEMAIVLLDAAARAAALLLDSNLRIWPDPALLAAFEPQLVALRERLGEVRPVASVR